MTNALLRQAIGSRDRGRPPITTKSPLDAMSDVNASARGSNCLQQAQPASSSRSRLGRQQERVGLAVWVTVPYKMDTCVP
jgi:hypothetical protein